MYAVFIPELQQRLAEAQELMVLLADAARLRTAFSHLQPSGMPRPYQPFLADALLHGGHGPGGGAAVAGSAA